MNKRKGLAAALSIFIAVSTAMPVYADQRVVEVQQGLGYEYDVGPTMNSGNKSDESNASEKRPEQVSDGALKIDIDRSAVERWENLTYKGGMSEYWRLVNSFVKVTTGGIGLNFQPWIVDGYVVGIPYVPKETSQVVNTKPPESEPTETVPPETEPPETATPETMPPETESNTAQLTPEESAEVSKIITEMLKSAVSVREETKATTYLLSSQAQEAADAIKTRNNTILQKDDNDPIKLGLEGIRKMMAQLVKADKAQISSITPVTSEEIQVSLSIPVFSTFKTLNEEMSKQFTQEVDLSLLNGIGMILSDPLNSRGLVDATAYDTAMKFMHAFSSTFNTTDLYTKYPSQFQSGSMVLVLHKEGNTWKIDRSTAVISVTIDGASDSITLLQ